MDKIVVVGGYGFLGFSLCTHLLDKGNMVDCIHFENSHDVFYEEKRLSVGRNANFTEILIEEWVKSELTCDEKTLVIISFYDLFLKKDVLKLVSRIEKELTKIFRTGRLNHSSLLLLLPLQVLAIADESEEPFSKSLNHLLKEVQEKGISYQAIYLPTLYGPWQPMDFLFQQVILNEVKNHEDLHFNKQEWTMDAIYIEDATNEIVRILDGEYCEKCILKSDKAEQWKKCAEYLGIEQDVYRNGVVTKENESTIICREIQTTIGYEQGLAMQKQHLLRILSQV